MSWKIPASSDCAGRPGKQAAIFPILSAGGGGDMALPRPSLPQPVQEPGPGDEAGEHGSAAQGCAATPAEPDATDTDARSEEHLKKT